MPQEIKFRGWDGEKKRMWSWYELMNTHPLGCLHSHNDGSLEVMQYTGLCDKNGKDIYEGDACKVTNPYGDIDKTCIVQWNSSGSCYSYEPFDGYGDFDVSTIAWAMQMGYQFEIVGNIHENPELLAE